MTNGKSVNPEIRDAKASGEKKKKKKKKDAAAAFIFKT